MKNIVRVILFTSVISVAASSLCAKGWRGIVPLHSTRADVERLIGKPDDKYDNYDFENERVHILYSDAPCSEGGYWSVSPGTVLSITITPKGKVKLSDLGINLKEFERVEEPVMPPTYRNRLKGLSYAVYPAAVGEADGETIRYIHYGPAAGDEGLVCPEVALRPPCKRQYHLCPMAYISDQTGPCVGSVHKIAATIAGVDPDDSFTFNWTVSAGEITRGQGTMTITVDMSKAGGKPVVATAKAVSALCEACVIEDSYTIEPCPKRGVTKGGRRR